MSKLNKFSEIDEILETNKLNEIQDLKDEVLLLLDANSNLFKKLTAKETEIAHLKELIYE